MPPRYVVISPVRDEEQYLERTIDSMIRQTVRPVQWLLVNDGSTDRTGEIVESCAAKEPWIQPVHVENELQGDTAVRDLPAQSTKKPGRGARAQQAKEIEAFYRGFERLTVPDWDFIVKLDGDVSFDPSYFESCLEEFAKDPKLGIGGGAICHLIDGELRPESSPHFHVRGATKIYRRACWGAIGGVVRGAGWDTLDEVKANMLGWDTRSFEQLRVVHHRFTGSANGAWRNAVKNGVWSYISGYHPLYMMLRCAKRAFSRPYLLASCGLFYGYFLGYAQKIPQNNDSATRRYLREQQLRRMFLRNTVWK